MPGLFILFAMLFSFPAFACMESAEKKEMRFIAADTNHDNTLSMGEFISYQESARAGYAGPYTEAEKQATKDHHFKNKDTMTKEEFMKISFVKGC